MLRVGVLFLADKAEQGLDVQGCLKQVVELRVCVGGVLPDVVGLRVAAGPTQVVFATGRLACRYLVAEAFALGCLTGRVVG